MNRKLMRGIGTLCMLLIGAVSAAGNPALAAQAGEELFNRHCAVCHPSGGNIISPQKSLRKQDMKANNIGSAGDIVHIMRNPGPGMAKFDQKTIPDGEARLIADYIIKTF